MIHNQDEVKGQTERIASIQKDKGLDLYLKLRLKLIQDFEKQSNDYKVTDLKKLLELEKAMIVQLTRKF